MATYEIELEDGSKYQIETEDDAPATPSTPELDASSIPTPEEPEGSYPVRFAKELGSPEGIKDTVAGIPSGIWNTLKSAYGTIADLPEKVGNIYDDPMGSIERNGKKALLQGAAAPGKIAARMNPFGMLTGPAYDKLLSVINPEEFAPTTPEQDAAKVRGETVMGATGLLGAKAASAGLGAVARGGRTLRENLTTKVIPEETIPAHREQGVTYAEINNPEVKATFTDWEPPPSFNDILTAAQRAKGIKTGKVIDPVTGKVTSSLEKAIESNRDLIDLPADKSLKGILGKKDAALNRADELVAQAEKARQPLPGTSSTISTTRPGKEVVDWETGQKYTLPDEIVNETIDVPPSYKLQTPKAEEYVANIKDPIQQQAAAEYLAKKTGSFESQWDGSIETLHGYRKQLTSSNPKAYEKGLGDVNPDRVKIDKALAGDLNKMIDGAASGYKGANAKASEMLRLEPLAVNRAAKARAIQDKNMSAPVKAKVLREAEYTPAQSEIGKWVPEKTIPEQQIPGKWQNKVDGAVKILGPVLGATTGGVPGALAGTLATQMGGAASLMGRTAGAAGSVAGGLNQALASPAVRMLQGGALGPVAGEMQAESLLPRDTEQFTAREMETFLLKTAATPQAPVAQQLVGKLRKALQAQDMDTVEKIHSDMARIFPDEFEPGVGVNGKVFYPDEQAKVMDNLRQLQRMGVVDSIHLAKQQNAFNNPQDSRMLPMTPANKPTYDGKPRFHEGTRIYSY